ncbi:hypothetical protein BX600DRAFT_154964 [Xylariales sp. PMI_506]|nr:hypothetical protein BX600DRAFT_154964 [Xylariales sp. PMI_506]
MDNTGHESTKPAHGEPSASVAAATMNNIEPAQELTGNESRSAGPGHVESATLDNIEPAPQLAGNGSESASLGHVESTAPTLDVTMGDIDSASEPTDKESALSQETGQTTPHETTNSLPTASDTAASEAAASTAAIVKADEPAAAGPSTISAPSMANDTGSIFNDASSFGTPSSFSIPLSVDDSDDNTDGDSALGSVLPYVD